MCVCLPDSTLSVCIIVLSKHVVTVYYTVHVFSCVFPVSPVFYMFVTFWGKHNAD